MRVAPGRCHGIYIPEVVHIYGDMMYSQEAWKIELLSWAKLPVRGSPVDTSRGYWGVRLREYMSTSNVRSRLAQGSVVPLRPHSSAALPRRIWPINRCLSSAACEAISDVPRCTSRWLPFEGFFWTIPSTHHQQSHGL